MKMIKPILNISKIADNYETFVLGYSGVLSEGNGLLPDAAVCLRRLSESGKKIIVISNTSRRIALLGAELAAAGADLSVFDCIMTAGEILHYKLKARRGDFSAVGNRYYRLGSVADDGVFAGLDYEPAGGIENAHFLYMSEVASADDVLEKYLPALEHAASLGLPFICAGNDTSSFKNGKICLAPGALAEQYAVMGGRIITVGKPDAAVFNYCLDGIARPETTLVIGDNLATDIKGAGLIGADAVLVSKGVHVNYLGEGYIPDVAKTRELSNGYDVSPSYVISNLRW